MVRNRNQFFNRKKDDVEYETEVSYELCINDYLYVYDDYVTYCWNELYFGGCDYNSGEFKFEDFIYNYKNDCF